MVNSHCCGQFLSLWSIPIVVVDYLVEVNHFGHCQRPGSWSGEGRGTGGSWEQGGIVRVQRVVENQPTSLMRGEGLATGWLCMVGGVLGW